MRRILLIVTIIIFLRPLLAQDAIFPDDEVRTYSGPDISGSLENSTTLGSDEGSASFADIIELELILERRYDNWEIHTDTVLSAYYLSGDETPDDYDAKIHRAYFRIFEDNVIMSAGKLFINQGVAGIFNPFLVDQTVEYTDIHEDRDGILALDIIVSTGALSEMELYAAYDRERDSYRTGAESQTNIGTFDTGIVVNRIGENTNRRYMYTDTPARTEAGIYAKGDVMIGVNGSYNAVLDDGGGMNHQAVIGADYSFLSGKVVTESSFYYNHDGVRDFNRTPYPGSFPGRLYNYSGVSYTIDDFSTTGIRAFSSLLDGHSALIVPWCETRLYRGLTAAIMIFGVTGSGGDAYSVDRYTDYGVSARLIGTF